MYVRRTATSLVVLTALFLVSLLACNTVKAASALPNPNVDEPLAKAKGQQTIVLSGGCFWGVQAVFEHVKGVTGVTPAYAGDGPETPHCEALSTEPTRRAASVSGTIQLSPTFTDP